ncbi:hypothetical protein A3H22_02685 [Candidatus Peribacteria bacterium RIFCSPLOWO2_12_FULL_55_15]|nr:MAG: hypothetical protein A2789_04070 [Candidatus Peribacteria bacterium RIFCSPHIGHO2_01_FULL_54_22]OGJ63253.1 MAG: hypothetical protein A3D12_02895 [Candidatus Peribacteria bacterium RIFCSPHIGHO2_02_FULL_55_24]OGJ63776.1 MAG: hypothetical protein A3E47_00015 [Candidatus Peribacteria bacterium RIFCSPHIGHO2_12_FULL_54_10]OGJ68161.1 MAG: hypothetical protein A2947_03890 [Candidatus Peribacteria bacterium RIFCSPLOWO2_01_FULL_54_110]OGJ68685.1 MAG: hypothetical protein A3H90_03180 [Candidatus Pe
MAPRYTPEKENGISDTPDSENGFTGFTNDELLLEIAQNPDKVELLSPELQEVVRDTQKEIDLDLE